MVGTFIKSMKIDRNNSGDMLGVECLEITSSREGGKRVPLAFHA
jgi:hypothetical protein